MYPSFIVYLIGHPGVGKLTIAKEMKNYILCDNHLINNVIFSLLKFDEKPQISEFAWSCVERVRDIVLDFISHDKVNNYILTNVLIDAEDEDNKIFKKVEAMAKMKNATLIPVKLFASHEIHCQRIRNIERSKLFKSRDIEDTKSYSHLLKISHKNLLELDTTHLTAKESAIEIEKHIKKTKQNNL